MIKYKSPISKEYFMWFYITMWNFNPQEFSNKLHIIGNLHHCGKYHLGNGELVNLSDFLQPILLRQVSMLYETEAVIIAAGITTAIVFVLTIFAFQVGEIGRDWEGLGRIGSDLHSDDNNNIFRPSGTSPWWEGSLFVFSLFSSFLDSSWSLSRRASKI